MAKASTKPRKTRATTDPALIEKINKAVAANPKKSVKEVEALLVASGVSSEGLYQKIRARHPEGKKSGADKPAKKSSEASPDLLSVAKAQLDHINFQMASLSALQAQKARVLQVIRLLEPVEDLKQNAETQDEIADLGSALLEKLDKRRK